MYDYNEMYPDYLMHYGVKGMKWGVRRARGHAGPGRYVTRKRQLAGDKRDLAYMDKGGHLSVGLTKKRQAAYDKRDRAVLEKRIAKNEKALADKQANKLAKLERKQKIKDTYKDIDRKTSLGERLVYNDATRKKAAKYMVDHNMSMKDANALAKSDARRNTAVILGAYGAVTVATLLANK